MHNQRKHNSLKMLVIQLLQIANQALQASPYNAIAYGVLVAILISAVAALWLRLVKEQNERVELITKVTELMTKILIAEEDDKALKDSIQELKFEIKTFIQVYQANNLKNK